MEESAKKHNSICLLLPELAEDKEKITERLFPIKLSNNFRLLPIMTRARLRKNIIVFIVFQTIGIMLRFFLCLCKYLAAVFF